MGNQLCRVQVNQSSVANITHGVEQLDVKCETKTKDNVFVNVGASIQYRAFGEKPTDAFYKLTSPRGLIQVYVFDAIRANVPKLLLDDVLKQKKFIARAVKEELQKSMSAYGYEIVQTLIVDVQPDVNVNRAMNEINADKAETKKIIQIKRAEGDAESKYLSGPGIARKGQVIVDALRNIAVWISAKTKSYGLDWRC
ncbi:hypothetical protein MKX03_032939 [Papaver bracteatum]|nr:hypothetical protein MKX03_032939 [Papaver bracteatum]